LLPLGALTVSTSQRSNGITANQEPWLKFGCYAHVRALIMYRGRRQISLKSSAWGNMPWLKNTG
jgi:hypothetical protein